MQTSLEAQPIVPPPAFQPPYQIEHAYCQNCVAIKPVTEQFMGNSACGKYTGTDIVCSECAWIVATVCEPIT